jgi:hypothetical protein
LKGIKILSGYIERASKGNVGAACSREFKCGGWEAASTKISQMVTWLCR